MRKTSTLLLFLFCFCNLSAQQTDFVEVLVEDTLRMPADAIIYRVSAVDGYEEKFSSSVGTGKAKSAVSFSPLMQVRNLVKEFALDTLPDETYLISNNPYERISPSMQIRFRSAVELRTFAARISGLKDIAAAVVAIKSLREEEAAQRLLTQLVTKAQQQAETLAKSTGKKLLRLVSVQEQPINGGWTMYPPLSSIPGWHTTGTYPDTYVTMQRRLAVRFAWQ